MASSMTTSRVERLADGERFLVEPEAIERELAELWREASDGGTLRPVSRACILNVIVVADGREPQEPSKWLDELVRRLPEHLAARCLTLRLRPEEPARATLTSFISANCLLAPGGEKLVCSEAIELVSAGPAATHLPALCRALLVPGVPTAVLFDRVPEVGDPLAEALLELSDRAVLWSARGRPERVLALTRRWCARRPILDLGWVAQSHLRFAIASLFEDAHSDAERIETVTVRPADGDREPGVLDAKGLLLARGWMASRLGATAIRSAASIGNGSVDHLVELPDRTVRFSLRPPDGPPEVCFQGPDLDRGVRFEADGGVRLERPSGDWRWVLPPRSPAALLAEAVLHRSADPELTAALRWAEALMEETG